MAESSMHTFLLDGGAASGTASWSAALCAVKSIPDIDGSANSIDVTTLSDTEDQSIPGTKSNPGRTFTANYDLTTFTTLKALEGTEKWFGIFMGGTQAAPTGANGVAIAKGYLTVARKGFGVNDPKEMEITLFFTSEIDNTIPT